MAWLCGGLVAGHVLVALKHHYIDRDGVLTRMLPRRERHAGTTPRLTAQEER
jgi:cytochrome b561